MSKDFKVTLCINRIGAVELNIFNVKSKKKAEEIACKMWSDFEIDDKIEWVDDLIENIVTEEIKENA